MLPPAHAGMTRAARCDDLAVIQCTSGSTGTPKCVMLSHRNLLASVQQSAQWMNEPETPNAGVLCVIPFFHVFGMTIGLHLTLAKGYRMILVPRFDALDLMPIVKLIETERPLSFPAVPTLWAALLSHPAATPELLSCIQVASSGAQRFLTGWLRAFGNAPDGPSMKRTDCQKWLVPHSVRRFRRDLRLDRSGVLCLR